MQHTYIQFVLPAKETPKLPLFQAFSSTLLFLPTTPKTAKTPFISLYKESLHGPLTAHYEDLRRTLSPLEPRVC
jgi:hypothetical protein